MNALVRYISARFQSTLEISLTASIVIAFVILARLLLKRAPKIFSYALWAVVLLRLLVPFSIESPMSLVHPRQELSRVTEVTEVLPEIEFDTPQDRSDNAMQEENMVSAAPTVQVSHIAEPEIYLAFLWVGGMGCMVFACLLSYGKLRRRLQVAVPYRKGILLADDIGTPFVLGLFRPLIYLPGNLESAERKYIIAHERHHIRRGDHIFKALGFLALTIHWFNPLVWVAFILAGRDMEMSCDEAVIRKLGPDIRADYSVSLLNLATGHRLFAVTPLAFGEGSPTDRVRNLAKWKKPGVWVIPVCILLCVILAVCLLTDPVGIHLYEIDDSRNYSDLYTHTDALTLIQNGKEYPVDDVDGFLALLDEIRVQKQPLNRSRSEDRDKTNQIRMREKLYLNFSRDFRHVWIDNLVKPTYSYRVTNPGQVKALFSTFALSRETGAAKSPMEDDWGISIKPDRVSRTGATALFVYGGNIPAEEGVELTYGDFLSLDRMVDGNWVPCDELAGYNYYVGDSSYSVVDGYGMVHEWPDRFGELADGHYRLGKQVTLIRADGSTESRMVYGEFSLPESVRTGLIPLNELPEVYSAEQAMIDGCFVTEDGTARENKELFQDFAVCSWNGMPGVIRIVNWHYGEDSRWSATDLSFDGNVYTITTLENTYTFKYLKQFTGEKAWEGADHDAFDYYVLVNDDSVTFEDIMSGKLDMSDWKNPAHWTVYANFIYRPKQPQLPMSPAQAVLEFEGTPLVTTTDFDRLEKIWILFQEAEYLGYEPKTHSVGIGLHLVLSSQEGETMTIELDPDSDICRINGEFVFYGAYDEPDYIEKLWYYLGIPQWPDAVYEKYPHAYKP